MARAALVHLLGPLLILRDVRDGRMHLSAIFVGPLTAEPGAVSVGREIVTPERLAEFGPATVWRAEFSVPADAPSSYSWNGETFEIASDLGGDLRMAFVSCNGEEHDDLARDETERNAMWARLRENAEARPVSLLLHGGDQVYADEATKGHPLSEDWPKRVPRDPQQHDLDELRAHLKAKFLERYVAQLAHGDYAWLVARIPSLAQWDDHDICDGWGSLPRSRTYSPVGRVLFEVAREATLLFQHGTTGDALPARFTDPEGYHLGWQVEIPGARIIGPDLRSERTRRQVLSDAAWATVEAEAERAFEGQTFIVSSVPLLGPRLSILESLMVAIPKMQEYEDDLRDQWQSRAHRKSWQRMLRAVDAMQGQEAQSVTVLSGEIHLATRATMTCTNGEALHQLVASGITHRAPPKAWAVALHCLAALGEAPLPDHPIRIERIPGQRRRYVAERNFLLLDRESGDWAARWIFEHHGASPPLPISETNRSRA